MFEHLNLFDNENRQYDQGRGYDPEECQRLLKDIHTYQNKVLDLINVIKDKNEGGKILDPVFTQFEDQVKKDTIEEKGKKWLTQMQSAKAACISALSTTPFP